MDPPRWTVELGVPGFFKITREWSTASPRQQIASLDNDRLRDLVARVRARRRIARRSGNLALEELCNDVIDAAEATLHDRQEVDARRER